MLRNLNLSDCMNQKSQIPYKNFLDKTQTKKS